MTPLAHRLTRQLMLRPKDRSPFWRERSDQLRRDLSDIHCFDVSDILHMIMEIGKALNERYPVELMPEDVGSMMFFLPAPKTWIEWRDGVAGERLACLLQEDNDRASADLFFGEGCSHLGTISLKTDHYHMPGGQIRIPVGTSEYVSEVLLPRHAGNRMHAIAEYVGHVLSMQHYLLAAINSPKILGRKQVMPHAGLERELVKRFGVGSFPLHAWTEIKLDISKPPEIDDGEPHEAHLTGQRALHFCRKHLRIRNGKFEAVSSHWRGDPALGLKRSRYRLSA